jgi:pimeloyl-ACP methyl ester carboxylesterase
MALVACSSAPSRRTAAAITARVPHVRRLDIRSVGHMLNLEVTERFNAELLTFLASR